MDIRIAETDGDRAACVDLRRIVFIGEQGVSEAVEVDGLDDQCIHILARDGDVPLGTARVRLSDGIAKVQRVCVPADHRGKGIGAAVMLFIVEMLRNDRRASSIRLGSQTHALAFYRKLGFREYGGEYLDAGIPHRDMELSLEPETT